MTSTAEYSGWATPCDCCTTWNNIPATSRSKSRIHLGRTSSAWEISTWASIASCWATWRSGFSTILSRISRRESRRSRYRPCWNTRPYPCRPTRPVGPGRRRWAASRTPRNRNWINFSASWRRYTRPCSITASIPRLWCSCSSNCFTLCAPALSTICC